MKDHPKPTGPVRNPDNTSLTISLPKQLKNRIEHAADADRRKVSPWCVIQLEKVLDDLEKEIPGLASLPKPPIKSTSRKKA
jgi:hypothetical protein